MTSFFLFIYKSWCKCTWKSIWEEKKFFVGIFSATDEKSGIRTRIGICKSVVRIHKSRSETVSKNVMDPHNYYKRMRLNRLSFDGEEQMNRHTAVQHSSKVEPQLRTTVVTILVPVIQVRLLTSGDEYLWLSKQCHQTFSVNLAHLGKV